jgi:transcriptional regulator with XRE-family HTH domain
MLTYLAQLVKEYRAKNSLSVLQFAARAQLPAIQIEHIEAGHYDIPTLNLLKIGPVLGCPASELLEAVGLSSGIGCRPRWGRHA